MWSFSVSYNEYLIGRSSPPRESWRSSGTLWRMWAVCLTVSARKLTSTDVNIIASGKSLERYFVQFQSIRNFRRKLNSLQTGWATEKAELTNQVNEYERKLKSHGINTEVMYTNYCHIYNCNLFVFCFQFLDDAIEEMEIVPPESD